MNHSQDKIWGLLQGEGREGNGRVIMYSTGLVGALVMTSSTLWPLITNVSTHDGPRVPLEFKFSTHRQTWVKLSRFSPTFFFWFRPIPRPPFLSPNPTPPPPTMVCGHTLGLSLIWLRLGRSSWAVASGGLQGLCLKWASTARTHKMLYRTTV